MGDGDRIVVDVSQSEQPLSYKDQRLARFR